MDLESVRASIVGTYQGSGHGIYPTISDFDYSEQVIFELSPKGFITYAQTTKNMLDASPLHQERGYLRILADYRVEFLIVQPTGIAEISTGVLLQGDGFLDMSLDATGVMTSPSAKVVKGIGRSFRFSPNGLGYTLFMATEEADFQLHLEATLAKVPGSR